MGNISFICYGSGTRIHCVFVSSHARDWFPATAADNTNSKTIFESRQYVLRQCKPSVFRLLVAVVTGYLYLQAY
jgi:hypothetical protein